MEVVGVKQKYVKYKVIVAKWKSLRSCRPCACLKIRLFPVCEFLRLVFDGGLLSSIMGALQVS